MKSLEIYKSIHYSVLSGKNKLFYNIILTKNHAWHIPKVIEISIKRNNNKKTTPFCHVLCLGMHSNVKHRFMVQAFQDPPVCSITVLDVFSLCTPLSLFIFFAYLSFILFPVFLFNRSNLAIFSFYRNVLLYVLYLL